MCNLILSPNIKRLPPRGKYSRPYLISGVFIVLGLVRDYFELGPYLRLFEVRASLLGIISNKGLIRDYFKIRLY